MFYSWGNWGTETLRDLPRIISGEVGVESRQFISGDHMIFYFLPQHCMNNFKPAEKLKKLYMDTHLPVGRLYKYSFPMAGKIE